MKIKIDCGHYVCNNTALLTIKLGKKMNKLIIGALLVLSSSAFANSYVGIQGGAVYDGLDASNNHSVVGTLREDDSRIAGRLFVGESFNKYFSIEAGYLAATNASIQIIDSSKIKVKEQIVDVAGKGSWYMGDKFFIDGKFGFAYLNTKVNDKKEYTIDPFFGAGIGYDINDNISLDVSWTRYAGSRDSADDLVNGKYKPSLDFYGIGLTYKF